jgi:hypothetical protein
MVQVLLVGVSKLAVHEHDRYHDYHGMMGLVLIGLRVVLWILFIALIHKSRK